MGSLLDSIAKKREENEKAGIHQTIPYPPLEQKSIVVAAATSEILEHTQISNDQASEPPKKPGAFSLGKKVLSDPGPVVKQVNPVPAQTNKIEPSKPVVANSILQTPTKIASVLNDVQPVSVQVITPVDTETFNRGSEKYTEQEMQEIKDAIQFIKSNFEHVDLIDGAFQTIMRSLKANPNLEGILGNEDIGTMVRAIRQKRIVHCASGEQKVETKKRGKQIQSNVDDAFAAILAEHGLDKLDGSK